MEDSEESRDDDDDLPPSAASSGVGTPIGFRRACLLRPFCRLSPSPFLSLSVRLPCVRHESTQAINARQLSALAAEEKRERKSKRIATGKREVGFVSSVFFSLSTFTLSSAYSQPCLPFKTRTHTHTHTRSNFPPLHGRGDKSLPFFVKSSKARGERE